MFKSYLHHIFESFVNFHRSLPVPRLILSPSTRSRRGKSTKGSRLSSCRDQGQLRVHALIWWTISYFLIIHSKTCCRTVDLLIFCDVFDFETKTQWMGRSHKQHEGSKRRKWSSFLSPPHALIAHFFISVPWPLVLTSRKEVGRPHPS